MYSIGVASRLSGVPAATIRVWERRYSLPEPGRSEGGHRVYSEADVELLRAVKALVDTGERVGTIAKSDRASIIRRGHDLDSAEGAASPAPTPSSPARSTTAVARMPHFDEVLAAVVAAAKSFDTARAAQLLDQPLIGHHPREVVLGLYLPLLHEVGELWHRGELSVASEHFVEKLVTARIHALIVAQPQLDRPEALCACLPGERHEAGLLAAALILHDEGYRITYLGADLPAADLEEVVEGRTPTLVVLSSTIPPPEPELNAVKGAVRRFIDEQIPVAVGGLGGSSFGDVDGVSVVESLDALAQVARGALPSARA